MNWITYERYGRGSHRSTITRMDSEEPPKHYPMSRPATEEEIAKELEWRESKKDMATKAQMFSAREDYKIAREIRDILEWVSPEEHPLDRLTIEEWKAFRDKLRGDK